MLREVWILEKKSGRNLYNRAYTVAVSDPDLLTSFLTALYRFAEELSSESEEEETRRPRGIESVEMGGMKWVYIEDVSLLYICASELTDNTSEIRAQLNIIRISFNEMFEAVKNPEFGDVWDGNVSQFDRFTDKIDELANDWKKVKKVTNAAELMDVLEVYQQLFHLLARVTPSIVKGKEKMLDQKMEHLKEVLPAAFKNVKYGEHGWDLLTIDVFHQDIKEEDLHSGLHQMLRYYLDLLTDIFKVNMKEIISRLVFPYLKQDWDRIRKLNLDSSLIQLLLIP